MVESARAGETMALGLAKRYRLMKMAGHSRMNTSIER